MSMSYHSLSILINVSLVHMYMSLLWNVAHKLTITHFVYILDFHAFYIYMFVVIHKSHIYNRHFAVIVHFYMQK